MKLEMCIENYIRQIFRMDGYIKSAHAVTIEGAGSTGKPLT